MRKILSQGLYTVMDGMCSSQDFAADVEVCEPLQPVENKVLYGLFADECGSEKDFTEGSQTELLIDERAECVI